MVVPFEWPAAWGNEMLGMETYTGYDWGQALGIFAGDLFLFVVFVLSASKILGATRLVGWKRLIASLAIGHVAANVFNMLMGPNSRWTPVGYFFSRVVGVPLLALFLWRRYGREAAAQAPPADASAPAPKDEP